MAGTRIYLSAPHMGGDELGLIEEAFRTNWISTVGPHLGAFETELAERVGGACVALSSGTAAIHLGLRLLGVEADDEVVVPTLTFVASVNPVLYQKARPVFVDSERDSWNLDPERLESLLSARRRMGRMPKAVVVVHLYGQSANLTALCEICGRFGVPLLEDAAEALGTTYQGRQVGTFGEVGTFSFNGNKIITTSGGGALTAKKTEHVEKVRFWSTQARDPGLAYEHSEVGYNYRLSNVLAAVGRGQLRVLSTRVEQRRAVAFRYAEAFADLEGLSLMPQADWGLHTNWLSVFTVDPQRLGVSRDQLIEALAEDNIEARPVWKPMHLQPLFRDAERVGGEFAADCFARGLCLPSSSFLSANDQGRVIERIRQVVRDGGR